MVNGGLILKKSISDIINTNYKEYSMYVMKNRAIPNVIDGLKPVHRKILYLIKNQNKFIKTAALGANLISQAGYNHGDSSASGAASLMAQNFVGSNNIPLLEGQGSFGNRFIQEPSAPRYTYVKKSKVLDYIYKDYDLCLKNPDPENPEALYYLPIIPVILVNGIRGIAVGFATDIPSFNIYDLINNSIKILNNKKTKTLLPYINGYNGKILNEDNIIIQKGTYEILNSTKIHITEIPTSFDREKYLSHLNKLIDQNLIISYEDNSKNNWDIIINLPKKSNVWNDIEKHLKLVSNINYNITTIDENNNLKIFETPNELLEYFVKFRLKKFEERRLNKISLFTNKINYDINKIKFIRKAIEYDFKNKSKKKIYDDFNKEFISEELDVFLKMSVYSLNNETIKEIKEKIKEYIEEKKYYENITAEELYIKDLRELEQFCKKEKI
jgi:DNA gyrase/topoisomerase IV subunit A